jgi:hypothetical protein
VFLYRPHLARGVGAHVRPERQGNYEMLAAMGLVLVVIITVVVVRSAFR